jgi:hypothetical protein
MLLAVPLDTSFASPRRSLLESDVLSSGFAIPGWGCSAPFMSAALRDNAKW